MKTKKSQDLFEKSKHHIAGGVNSPVRAFKSVGGTPIFFKKSRECYLYDEDGNKYLDFVGSWGPMVLGHSNKNIVSAINLFINNLNSFKKNIEKLDDRTLRKKLINSKKVRQQILSLKQDIAKPDFGRDLN